MHACAVSDFSVRYPHADLPAAMPPLPPPPSAKKVGLPEFKPPSTKYLERKKSGFASYDSLHAIETLVRQKTYSELDDRRRADSVDGTTAALSEEEYAWVVHGVIIPSHGSWKPRWDMLILFLILYSSVAVPFRVCFSADAAGVIWIFEVAMSFCFLCDCCLTFRTAYLEDGSWVTAKQLIASKYLKGWFWIDAPSSLPLELLDLIPGSDASSFAMLRFLRILRLLRLLKLLRLDSLIDTLEEIFETSLRILRLVFMVAKLMVLAHSLGCFWYGIAALTEGAGGDTWVTSYGGDEETPTSSKYLWSLYWALTTLTTVGYGDIIPTNDGERLYALASLLVSALVFGSLLSNIGSLVASLDRQAAALEEKMDGVKEYVAGRALPRDLANRFRKHFQYFYTQRPIFDEVQLLNDCPPKLRTEVIQFVLKETLGKLALFKNLDPEFLGELFPYVRPKFYEEGSVIFSKGEASRELLFLLEGQVDNYSRTDENVVETRITPTKRIFVKANMECGPDDALLPDAEHNGMLGESVLTGRRHDATSVAKTPCHTVALTKNDMQTVFAISPKAARRIADAVIEQDVRKQRLAQLNLKFLITFAPVGSPTWAALYVQRAWGRYVSRWLVEPLGVSPSGETPATLLAKSKAQDAEESDRMAVVEYRASLLGRNTLASSLGSKGERETSAKSDESRKSSFKMAMIAEAGSEQPDGPAASAGLLQALEEMEGRVLLQVTQLVKAEFEQLREKLL